jgi:hypothetical protein
MSELLHRTWDATRNQQAGNIHYQAAHPIGQQVLHRPRPGDHQNDDGKKHRIDREQKRHSPAVSPTRPEHYPVACWFLFAGGAEFGAPRELCVIHGDSAESPFILFCRYEPEPTHWREARRGIFFLPFGDSADRSTPCRHMRQELIV